MLGAIRFDLGVVARDVRVLGERDVVFRHPADGRDAVLKRVLAVIEFYLSVRHLKFDEI